MSIAEIIAWLLTSTAGIQIKNSLDPVTIEKTIKGMIRAALSSAVFYGVLAALNYLSGVQLADPFLTSVLTWMAQSGTNAWVEYHKGEKVRQLNM